MNLKCGGLVLLLLLAGGCESLGLGDFGDRLRNSMTGNTPFNAARAMEDQYFPDERRKGISKLSEQRFGQRPPYTQRYQQIAQYDSDWLVRAVAIRALNRSRDASATPIFIKALSDSNDLVRVEAAKALGNLPDPDAVPELLRIVGSADESRDARIWAAAALRHYRNLEVARTLVNQLGGREFGIAWQAHRSLVTITGRDLRYEESAWLDYLTGDEKPFG